MKINLNKLRDVMVCDGILVMVLIGYESDDNRLRVLDKVDRMVSHPSCKHLHQRLLPTMHQFSGPEL